MSNESNEQTAKRKKRTRVPVRELHALRDDNNQRSSLNLPKCPICSHRIEPQYWQIHYNYELDRLNQLDSDVYTDPMDKTKGKRGAAVLARQHMEKKYRKRPTTIYEEALQKVKHNTAQRKEALKRLDAPQSDLVDPSSSSLLNQELLNTDQQQTCFICNETLFGDSEAINLHIDRCLMNMNEQPTTTSHNNNNNNNLSPQDGNDWDQYEWAGQVRVRATSMMEGGYGGAGFATAQKEDDVDEDLDIEEDDAEYGHSQYNERDIMVNMDEDNDDSNALREMISEGSSIPRQQQQQEEEQEENNRQASPQSGFEETVSDAGWDRHLAMDHPSSSEISQSTTGNLVVDSLKSRIHQLEMASRSVPRCLICLEPYKTPLTSIICWHVHCEQCWLQTLGSKKLCPQCQKITTPSDLRRIYL